MSDDLLRWSDLPVALWPTQPCVSRLVRRFVAVLREFMDWFLGMTTWECSLAASLLGTLPLQPSCTPAPPTFQFRGSSRSCFCTAVCARMLRAYVVAHRYVYGQEVQAIATAQDDDLVIWKKVQCCVATTVTLTAHSEERCAMQASNNPVIPGPPPSLSVVGFRDPMVQWQPDQQQYRMLLGSGIRNSHGTSLMYTATDLDGPWSYRYAGWRQGVVPGGTDPSGLCGVAVTNT